MALRSQLSRRWWCRVKILVKGCCRERRSQFLSVSAAKRQPLPPQSPDLHFFRSHAHLFSTSAPCFPLYTILPYIYSIFLLWRIHRISIRKQEREMEIVGGLFGKLGRQSYAVLCLGVLLVSVTIAHCVCAAEPTDPREPATRRLRAFHGDGGPLRPSQTYWADHLSQQEQAQWVWRKGFRKLLWSEAMLIDLICGLCIFHCFSFLFGGGWEINSVGVWLISWFNLFTL